MTNSNTAVRGILAPGGRPTMHPSIRIVALCGALLAPASAEAQQLGYYVRLAPGFSRTTVEHTKELSVGPVFNFISSTSNAIELSMHIAGGFRAQPRQNWFLDIGVEAIIYAPRTIEGDIDATGGDSPYEISEGAWEYINKNGMGLNIGLERRLGLGSRRLLLFAGVHRMQTEVMSSGSERTGALHEDRELRKRWPFTGGAGVAWGPMHLRVSYFRSLIPWNFLEPELEIRYRWRASGLSATLGAEVF